MELNQTELMLLMYGLGKLDYPVGEEEVKNLKKKLMDESRRIANERKE